MTLTKGGDRKRSWAKDVREREKANAGKNVWR